MKNAIVIIVIVCVLNGGMITISSLLRSSKDGNIEIAPSHFIAESLDPSVEPSNTLNSTPIIPTSTPTATPIPTVTPIPCDQYKEGEELTYIYLSFSLEKYEEQRDFVKEYYAKEIKMIEEGPSSVKEIKIAISLIDLNTDSVDDILVLMFNPYFSGHLNNTVLFGFVFLDSGIDKYGFSQHTLDWENLSFQRVTMAKK